MKQWNSITKQRLLGTATLSPCVRTFVEQLYDEAIRLEQRELAVSPVVMPLELLQKQAVVVRTLNSNL
jgi:hypothetical protein